MESGMGIGDKIREYRPDPPEGKIKPLAVSSTEPKCPNCYYEFIISEFNCDNANKRSVWTVQTEPNKQAHFAVFPTKLVIDCIKAGCPQSGIVLDPFIGSGTVGEVALRLDRKFIGIDLNPDSVKMAVQRVEPHLTNAFYSGGM